MTYLTKKMLRSIYRFKFQFLAVFLMAMLSVTVYSGLEGIWSGVRYEFDRISEETNLADEWVLASYMTDEDIDQIRRQDGVTDLSARLRLSAVSTDRDGQDSFLSLDTAGTSAISSMIVTEGEGYRPELTESVWLDRSYAQENRISVGETIEIRYGESSIRATVRGIVLSAERAHFVGTADYYIPDHGRFGYGFMSDDIPALLGVYSPCNLLEIKSTHSAVRDSINTILGERFLAYYDRDSLFDVAFVSSQTDNLRKVSILFSSLFLLLCVLSMHTTIKRLIDAQSGDIATLQSLGFPKRSLILHYSMYGFFVSVLGCAAGFLASYPFSRLVQASQKKLIDLPAWPIRHTMGSLLVILLIIFLSTLTSVLAAKKKAEGLPAQSMQSRVRPSRKTALERIGGLWNRTGFGMRWTLRDAAAHKTRILLGIISVCGSFMLLMIGFGTQDSIKSFTDKSYSEEFVYTHKLTLNPVYASEETLATELETGGQLIETIQSRVQFGDRKETCFKPVTVFSDGSYLNLRTIDGIAPGADGAYITEGMAETLGIRKGDTVELFPSLSDRSFSFQIVGIIPSSMPQTLYIHEKCWRDAGAVFRPTHLLLGDTAVSESPTDSNIAVGPTDSALISQRITAAEQSQNIRDFRIEFSGVFKLMKVVAFVLVVIVLYNLSILSFLERTRPYNTFRVLGFHFREIRTLASFENLLILILGTAAGLPLGFAFLRVYCATFSNDTLKIYPRLAGGSLAAICAAIFICTALTTMLLSLRIRKIDMVRALKE